MNRKKGGKDIVWNSAKITVWRKKDAGLLIFLRKLACVKCMTLRASIHKNQWAQTIGIAFRIKTFKWSLQTSTKLNCITLQELAIRTFQNAMKMLV